MSAVVSVAVLLVLGLLVVLPADLGKRRGCVLDRSLAPSCGVWWGAALDSTDSKLGDAVAARERADNRRLDIVHVYHRWYDSFPTASEKQLVQQGHLLLLNWEPVDRGGRPMSWAAIAAGQHDAEIRQLGRRLAPLGAGVLISFSHEPEAFYRQHGGSATAFVAAFRHVHDLIAAAGADQVRWVWNTMGLADPVWRARYRQLYPGAAYVDWIAWDPYNWGSCRQRTWQSFASTVKPFYDWLRANGFGDKPFMLAEFGSVEQAGSAGGKADWLAGIPAALAGMPELKALVYFDLPAPPANCDWRLGTSVAAGLAYRALGSRSPFARTARLPLP